MVKHEAVTFFLLGAVLFFVPSTKALECLICEGRPNCETLAALATAKFEDCTKEPILCMTAETPTESGKTSFYQGCATSPDGESIPGAEAGKCVSPENDVSKGKACFCNTEKCNTALTGEDITEPPKPTEATTPSTEATTPSTGAVSFTAMGANGIIAILLLTSLLIL